MSVLYITEQGGYLHKSGGRFVVSRDREELTSIPAAALDRVLIFGNCQVSSQVISELLTDGIQLVYLGRHGRFKGFLQPGYPKDTCLRLAQYEASLNDTFCNDVVRSFRTSYAAGGTS